MKVILSLLIVVVLFIGFSMWTQHYLVKTTDKMVDQLKKIESAVKDSDWNSAHSHLASLKSTWVSTKNIWQTLLDHQEIDNIDMSLSRVNKMIEIKDSSQALPEMAALKLLVMHVPDKESFRLENVL